MKPTGMWGSFGKCVAEALSTIGGAVTFPPLATENSKEKSDGDCLREDWEAVGRDMEDVCC